MADNYEAKIILGADTKGADDTVKALDRVETKASSASKKTAGGFQQIQTAVGKASHAVGLFNRALAGFGIVGLFTSALAAVNKFTSGIKKAEEAAKKLTEEQEKAADTERVKKLADEYDKLTTSISASAKARARANELEDLEKKNEREFEDEAAKFKMNTELAALDPNDPEYELKKRQITSRYELEKSQREVRRKGEDLETAADREGVEGGAKDSEAFDLRTQAIEEGGELSILKRKKAEAEAASKAMNDKDHTGLVLKGFQALGLKGTTDEGDAEREKQKAKAEELQKRIEAQEKKIEELERKAQEAEAEASQHYQRGAYYAGAAERTKLIMTNVSDDGQRSVDAANKALADKRAADADAKAAMASLEIEKREVKERIAAAQARKDAAGRAQFEAQGEYDLAVSNGANRATQTSAYQNLQSATINAQNVGAEADATIKALNETLRSIESRLKAAKDHLEKQSGQTKYAWSEQPAGD